MLQGGVQRRLVPYPEINVTEEGRLMAANAKAAAKKKPAASKKKSTAAKKKPAAKKEKAD